MRLIVDNILWGAIILLFGPTVMIVASWNALPGDNLYGVKLAMERAMATIASPSYASSGALQIKYTERRYAETKQLLASRQSIDGLPYLQQQIADTKKMIDNAPNKEAQVALAKQYINTLSTVSTDLEVQKQVITTSTPPPKPTVTSTPTPTPSPIRSPKTTASSPAKQDLASPDTPTPSPTRTPTSTPQPTHSPVPTQKSQIAVVAPITTGQAVVALQINQTQQNVSQTIAELQTLVDKDDNDQKDNRRKQEEGKGNKEDKNETKSNQDVNSRGKEPKRND